MKNPNNLTPAETERLTLLIEEMSEVIQIVCKILRHGYYSTHPDSGVTNKELLEKESGDVDRIYHMLLDNKDVDRENIAKASKDKANRIKKYLHYN